VAVSRQPVSGSTGCGRHANGAYRACSSAARRARTRWELGNRRRCGRSERARSMRCDSHLARGRKGSDDRGARDDAAGAPRPTAPASSSTGGSPILTMRVSPPSARWNDGYWPGRWRAVLVGVSRAEATVSRELTTGAVRTQYGSPPRSARSSPSGRHGWSPSGLQVVRDPRGRDRPGHRTRLEARPAKSRPCRSKSSRLRRGLKSTVYRRAVMSPLRSTYTLGRSGGHPIPRFWHCSSDRFSTLSPPSWRRPLSLAM
jgi:hypothetical protein